MRPFFEWDAGKAAGNEKKHGVSFDEAATVFDDPLFITVIDVAHSSDEDRYITIGISKDGRVLIIAHTDRNDHIRIISARKATKKEENYYAEAT